MIRNGKCSLSRDLNKFLDFIEGFIVQRRGLSSGVNVRYRRENVKSWIPHSERKLGNVKYGDPKRAQIEKMRVLVERIDKLAEELDEEEGEPVEKPNKDFGIRKYANSVNRTRGLLKQQDGVQPKVKKNVSFAENGKVYRVLRRHEEPSLEEYSDDSNERDSLVDVERQLEDDLSPETQEIGASIKDDDEEEEEEVHSEKGSDGEKDAHSYSTSEGNVERTRYVQDDADDFIFCAPLPAKMEKRGATQLTRGRN